MQGALWAEEGDPDSPEQKIPRLGLQDKWGSRWGKGVKSLAPEFSREESFLV